jgi:hypothetical protein
MPIWNRAHRATAGATMRAGAKGQVPASCATTGAISSIAVSKTTT